MKQNKKTSLMTIKKKKKPTIANLVRTVAGKKKKINYYKRYIEFLSEIIARQDFCLKEILKDNSEFMKNITRATGGDELPMWANVGIEDYKRSMSIVDIALLTNNKYFSDAIKRKIQDINDKHAGNARTIYRGLFGYNAWSPLTGTKLNTVKLGNKTYEVVVATGNKHKFDVFAKLAAPYGINLVAKSSLKNLPDVKEDGDTYEANAIKKAMEISRETRGWVIADDSGLELDHYGIPGVRSSRFAGDNATDADNRNKLKKYLKDNGLISAWILKKSKLGASYKCTIAVAYRGTLVRTFTGSMHGHITPNEAGSNGFSYDSMFVPDGFARTIAQMSEEEVNEISHRAIAFKRFLVWWKEISFQRK